MTTLSIQAQLEASKLNQPNSSKSKSDPQSDQVYNQILNNQLSQICDLCHQVGATDGNGGAQKVDGNNNNVTQTQISHSSAPSQQREKDLIDHGPIFLALMVVLFTGQDSSYHVLADAMGNLSNLMKNVQQYTNIVKQINDDLNNLMNGTGNPQQIAQDLAQQQKNLQDLLNNNKGVLSPDLVKNIEDYCKPGGDLDQVVAAATKGMTPPCSSWADAANNPAALQKIKDYLTNASGGSVGPAASTIFSTTSNLLGSLSTQNQAQVEQLNLLTQKVDSTTKLFASALTQFKGLIQTLTNYSGS